MMGLQIITERFSYLVAVGILFNILFIFASSLLMTNKKGVYLLTLLNIGGSLANTVIFVLCALLITVDIEIALVAYFFGIIIRMMPGAYMAVSGASIKISLDWITMSKKLFKYGAASFIFNIAVVMVFRVDMFIVNKLVGLEELGKYAVAGTFAEMVLILPSSIGTALFAHFPILQSCDQVELLKQTCRSVIVITATICIMLAIVSPWFVTILVGEQYVGAIEPLRWMLPGLVAMAAAYVFANYFAGTGHPILSAAVFGVGLIIKIGLNYLFVPSFGIIGAALASSCTYLAIALTFYLILRKMQRVTAASLFLPTFNDVYLIVSRAKIFIIRK